MNAPVIDPDDASVAFARGSALLIDARTAATGPDGCDVGVRGALPLAMTRWWRAACAGGDVPATDRQWRMLLGGVRGLGIRPTTPVVVFDWGREQRFGDDAMRMWCLLRLCGVGRVTVMDGGLLGWARKPLPVTRVALERLAARLKAREISGRWAIDRARLGDWLGLATRERPLVIHGDRAALEFEHRLFSPASIRLPGSEPVGDPGGGRSDEIPAASRSAANLVCLDAGVEGARAAFGLARAGLEPDGLIPCPGGGQARIDAATAVMGWPLSIVGCGARVTHRIDLRGQDRIDGTPGIPLRDVVPSVTDVRRLLGPADGPGVDGSAS